MKLNRAVWSSVLGVGLLAGCGEPASPGETVSPASLQSSLSVDSERACGDWPQWGQSPTHQGQTCSRGQPATQLLDDIVYDPFVAAEAADGGGLIVHYQSPLIAGDDLYMEQKSGSYIECDPPGSGTPAPCGPPATWQFEIWNEARYEISKSGKLTQRWSFQSDWKPEPLFGFEPVFHAALSGDLLYVPGAGGTVFKLDRKSGKTLARINPFGATVDPNIYVAGPISADAHGNIYYNALALAPLRPQANDGHGWLVKVSARGKVERVDYAALLPDAPKATDPCVVGYDPNLFPLPYPPLNPDGTVVPAATFRCGTQRPSINTAPAIAPDGTIYVVSHAHFNGNYSYLVAVHPNLTARWARSLRGLVHDGCGVLVPEDGDVNPWDCTPGAPIGIDPFTGEAPAMAAIDTSSSSPVVLPDGGVLYGAFSGYNQYRGHLLKFDRHGGFRGSFDFGWDVTPAVVAHDGTYSIVTKDNHYTFDDQGNDTGPYYLTRLSADLQPEWQFLSTNTKSCARDAQGQVNCVEDHPFGFEWCINAPAVDRDGNLFANSEDGNLYVIDKNGKEKSHFFLNLAIGAAYTPLALERRGHVFVLNGGHLSVLGQRDDDGCGS
jgi:outer membrane protein assembly factor BamB